MPGEKLLWAVGEIPYCGILYGYIHSNFYRTEEP